MVKHHTPIGAYPPARALLLTVDSDEGMALHDPAQFGRPNGAVGGCRLRHAGYRRSFVCPNLQGVFGGEYFADLLVEDALVEELKCAERLANQHPAQCLNYLRASGRTVCMLVNFQRPKVEWLRFVRGFAESPQAPAGNSGLDQTDQTLSPVNSRLLH